ncbi:DNA topoisomerase [Ligilactobacillus salivarius]|uniref:DNA topoisomerase n=1 Tax=Ligilactobacillus salivarius TaxID=1624 RepID=UPI000C7CBDCA|nr:DNA topoisomerase [Ligilactobacillus salivarius]PLA92319.1 type IA DNA topoisomerase [Ligilactobacillus salivarius]
MVDYLILTEKPSAAENFSTALGGKNGTFNGKTYKIVHARGHLLTLAEPQKQVDSSLKEKYKSWDPETIPWNLSNLSWKRSPIRNAGSILNSIKDAAQNAKAIVIATDNDPSGEGELLAWEIIEYIRWNGTVLREYHDDETPESIRKAMSNLKDVSDKNQDGEYLKGLVRNKWDFSSMQLTRLATSYAREAGFNVKVANQGRLKSVIISLVKERLDEIRNYVKKPYYEAKFKDENGHIYARKIKKDDEEQLNLVRHKLKEDAQTELSMYSSSPIGDVVRKTTTQAPPALLDLASLDAILSKRNYPSNQVKTVYQKLYEKGYVSYPRTEDKFITQEQFKEFSENADKIAALVDVNTNLLTHREARSSHVKSSATHGANRPGSNIPENLAEFNQIFDKERDRECAKDIYTVLARCTLAILAEDYVYEEVRASLLEYPAFETKFNIPKKLNYRKIYNPTAIKKEKDVGTNAVPFVFEGANSKPKAPTKKWLYAKLRNYGKYGVGTGATQQNTMSEITNSKANAYLLTDKQGKLDLTDQGMIAAVLCEKTYIASPNITIRLFEMMDEVGNFKREPQDTIDTVTKVIIHDKPIFKENATKLVDVLGKPKKSNNYVTAKFNDEDIKFKNSWGKYIFTKEEIDLLSKGEPISFTYKGATITGRLKKQTYAGHEYWGFSPDERKSINENNYTFAEINGEKIKFKNKWGSHIFSEPEIQALIRGETITFDYNGTEKSGKLEKQNYQGHEYWGFKSK